MKDADRFAVSISKIECRLDYKTLMAKKLFDGGKDVEMTMEE